MPSILQKTLLTLILMSVYLSAKIPDFNADRAYELLEKQVSFGPRYSGSAGYQPYKNWLINTASSLSDTVIIQPFTGINPSTNESLPMTNIIARIHPHQKKRILLSAHFDTRPIADEDPEPNNRSTAIDGANDGASGVAVLLHLMETLYNSPLDLGIDFIFWDGEDMGRSGFPYEFCQGSTYYARNIIKPKPKESILLDMIGDANLTVYYEYYSMKYNRKLMMKIWDIASDLGYSDIFIQKVMTSVYDDHMPLNQLGKIPSIDLIDFQYPSADENYWHTLEDTADKCSAESLGIIGEIMLYWIYTYK